MNLEDSIGYPKNLPDEFKIYFAAYHNENVHLKEEINSLRRIIYGRKCEKYIKEQELLPQGSLFDEAEKILSEEKKSECTSDNEPEKNPADEPSPKKKTSNKSTGGRKPLPKDLPREIKVHDLNEEQKICPYDHAVLEEIGEDVVEKLDIEPAKFKVVEHHYKKYACPCCKQFIAKEKAESSVLPSSIVEPALLAHVATNKFLYHLPLYRQEMIFQQIHIDLPRATLARWIIAAANSIEPIVCLIRKTILKNSVVHCDETPVQVLKGTEKSPTSKTYMWVMTSGLNQHPAVFFQYYTDRSKESALDFLHGFKGFLQVDGYDSYNAVCNNPSVSRVGCFAHVRRKFESAFKEGAKDGQSLAEKVLQKIQKLFLFEREWQNLLPQERLENRKIHFPDIFKELRNDIDENLYKMPPKSKIAKAMGYMANEWPYLVNILKSGLISLSNNAVENAIRPFALGRKNWLFANTVLGAQASANLYSIVGTALQNNLSVEKYLTHLFTVLPTAKEDPLFNYETLLPWNMPQEFLLPAKDAQ